MRLVLEMPKSRNLDDALYKAYEQLDYAEVLNLIGRQHGDDLKPDRIVDLPSLAFSATVPEPPSAFDRSQLLEQLESLIIAVEFDDPARGESFISRVRAGGGRVGADAPIGTLGDSWCPDGDLPPIFHTRDAALALIRADVLQTSALHGQGVNLVFFDEGISRAALAARFAKLPQNSGLALDFKGGWEVKEPGFPLRRPGMAKPDSHGTMVALNALALAPAIRVFDLPVLPDRIRNVMPFVGFAAAALIWARLEISFWLGKKFPGPWVFCHSWGVYNRSLEVPRGGYTANPLNPFNLLVAGIDLIGNDQIFAAGNGGQFCPNPQCGPGDIGPGNSIFGANSSPHVLTAGAVRADGMWIGYSSQGPGQPQFATSGMVEKPDICAPSHFVEPGDAAWVSSGTSAACGIAAGAVAALRGAGSPVAGLSTAELRQHLRDTAWKPPGHPPGYDIRMGHGILNLERALQGETQSAM